MSTDSNLSRESFQQFLASAFAVQESQIDGQMLSAIMEVERLVTKGELGVDGTMLLIVESARDVASAAGVAIGLLEGDRLIYRAGSGCSAAYTGSRVTASLTVATNTRTSREILRVENAQTDTRIEAAICRQFGAKALLILPIYYDRALAGVLEILFSEAHVFQDQEVRTYRLMAGLIEAALLRSAQFERKENLTTEVPTVPHASEQYSLQRDQFPHDERSVLEKTKRAIYQHCGTAWAAVREWPVLTHPGLLAARMAQRAKEASLHKPPWNVALAAVAAVLGLVFWIAYGGRGPASPSGSSEQPGSAAVNEQERVQPRNAMLAEGSSKGQSASVPVKEPRPARTRVRRVRTGGSEVDHIGEDVTVRHFIYKPSPQRRPIGASRVAYIGEDVTVRYFTPKPAVKSASR
jgi:hypothetical protein